MLNVMEWSKYIEKVHGTVKKHEVNPEERTEKGFYRWIMNKEHIQSQLDSWLYQLKSGAKKFSKDDEKAKRLKEEGNVSFKKKDYPSSVKSYTESARYASFNSDHFPMAIANRSASFFHMCRYQDSLQDIELALACNYPKESSWKLHIRAAWCHLKLRQGKLAENSLTKLHEIIKNSSDITASMKNAILKQAKEAALAAADSQKSYEKPVKALKSDVVLNPENMLEINTEFPFASSALRRKRSSSKGRYVVAGKSIKKGDILFVEKPFAWVPVTHDNDSSLCAHCCSDMNDSLVPCRGCLDALYCSATCWKDSWSYHQWECPGYHTALWPQIGISHLAFKILLMSMVTSDCVWFNNVQRLMTNIEKRSTNDLLGLTIASMMVTTYLEKYTNFFNVVDLQESLIDKFEDTNRFDVDLSTLEGKKLCVGSLMLRHSLQMLPNAYAIVKICESAESTERAILAETQQRIGAACYPSASMMNHSCDPSVIHTFWKNWIIVKAVKDVAEGQEIFNCYGPYFKRMSKVQRQQALWEQYHFHCECDACMNPHYDYYTDRFDGFKCPKCSGSSFSLPNDNIQRCFDCGTVSDVYFLKELKIADNLSDQGMNLTDTDKWEEAIPYFEKCLAIRKKYMYKHNTDVAIVSDALAQCHASNGRWLISMSYLEKSLAATEERFGSDSIEFANELNTMTDVLFQYLGNTMSRRTDEYREIFIKTQKYIDRALVILRLTGGPWNENYQRVNVKKEQLSGILEKLRI